jgi:ferrous-iron efflux pump FieF
VIDTSSNSDSTSRLLHLATSASVTTALLLVAIKIGEWWSTGAVSLLASVFDSGLDVVASVLTFIAVRYALTPADREHRFGHGKAEPLAALLQALIILGSCAFIVYEAVDRLLHPSPMASLAPAIIAMVFSTLATLGLVGIQTAVLRRTQSPAIRADRLHYQTDLLSNLATLAALTLSEWGLPRADPLFAFAIAAWMLYATRDLLHQALDQLLDRELPAQERETILSLAALEIGAGGVGSLRTRRAGRTRHIQLVVDFDADCTLGEADAIADRVKQGILLRFPDSDVMVIVRARRAAPT